MVCPIFWRDMRVCMQQILPPSEKADMVGSDVVLLQLCEALLYDITHAPSAPADRPHRLGQLLRRGFAFGGRVYELDRSL
mmetsp:Transcript_49133/g.113543  ORF Transcript_49133/g.113543 Transcript_49133/m.113543 type:complete len:80 (+) Transcript_49133:207-446(+)